MSTPSEDSALRNELRGIMSSTPRDPRNNSAKAAPPHGNRHGSLPKPSASARSDSDAARGSRPTANRNGGPRGGGSGRGRADASRSSKGGAAGSAARGSSAQNNHRPSGDGAQYSSHAPPQQQTLASPLLPTEEMSGRLGAEAGNWYEHAAAAASPSGSAAATTAAAAEAALKAERSAKRGRSSLSDLPSAPYAPALHARARYLLAAEAAAYEKRKSGDNSGESKWMRTVLAGGTSTDKLAALTLLVQESPLHTLRHLDALLALARKKSRREATAALESLRDLFLHNLLPDDRKLLPLSARSTADLAAASPALLVWWAFEDALKERYAGLLVALAAHLSDPLLHFRLAALHGVAELLTAKPEGEGALLPLLVNKLGDPEPRVAAKAEFLLSSLVDAHEAMKPTVVREVRQMLYRGGLAASARIHGVTFLSQMPLSPALADLARELIVTYFSLFKEATGATAAAAAAAAAAATTGGRKGRGGKRGPPQGKLSAAAAAAAQRRRQSGGVDTRLLSALLSGINRALPYATAVPRFASSSSSSREGATPDASNADPAAAASAAAAASQWAEIEARADALFLAVHAGNLTTSIQALMLLQQVVARRRRGPGGASASAAPAAVDVSASFSDRYYRTLYGVITVEALSGTTKHALFLNLVFKSMKADAHAGRVRATLKRLVQVSLHLPPTFAAGTVLLAAQLFRERPELLAPLIAISEGEQQQQKRSSSSSSGNGAQAIVAGASSSAATAAAAAAAAGAGEWRRLRRGRNSSDSDSSGSDGNAAADDDDAAAAGAMGAAGGVDFASERASALRALDDIMSGGGGGAAATSASAASAAVVELDTEGTPPPPLSSTATHRSNGSTSSAAAAAAAAYDSTKRDPAFAGAEASCLWELAPLALHFHPSVRAFAEALLSESRSSALTAGGVLDYRGDPLADFNLMAFLDRYVYKNPKAKLAAAAGAAAAAAAAGDDDAVGDAELAAGYAIAQGADPAALAAVAAGRVHGRSFMQRRVGRHGRVDVEAPVTSASFAALDESAVRAEDRFLHTYFKTKAAAAASSSASASKGRRGVIAGDGQSDDDGSAAAGGAGEDAQADAFADELALRLMSSATGAKRSVLRGGSGGEEEAGDDVLDEWMLADAPRSDDEEGASGDEGGPGSGDSIIGGGDDDDDDDLDAEGDADADKDDEDGIGDDGEPATTAMDGNEDIDTDGEDALSDDEALARASESATDPRRAARGNGRGAAAARAVGASVFEDADDYADVLASDAEEDDSGSDSGVGRAGAAAARGRGAAADDDDDNDDGDGDLFGSALDDDEDDDGGHGNGTSGSSSSRNRGGRASAAAVARGGDRHGQSHGRGGARTGRGGGVGSRGASNSRGARGGSSRDRKRARK